MAHGHAMKVKQLLSAKLIQANNDLLPALSYTGEAALLCQNKEQAAAYSDAQVSSACRPVCPTLH